MNRANDSPVSDHIEETELQSEKGSGSVLFRVTEVRQVKEGNTILGGVDLEITKGRITALIGPSGAGKTSLLRLFNRLDDPLSGSVTYNGHPIADYPVRELRREVGFVFQTPVMFPGTVMDNLRAASQVALRPASGVDERALTAMSLAGLDLELLNRDGDRLSVGQKQRANIARALMTVPHVLLMDEPTSALDPETADRLMDTVRRLCDDEAISVVMITHRLSEARRVSDFAVFMENGRVVEAGASDSLFNSTASPRLRAFLDSDR
jgi:ABC-type methionine transport system ATPase subunit